MIEAALLAAVLLLLLWLARVRVASPTRAAAAALVRVADAWEPVQVKGRKGWVTTFMPPAGHRLHGGIPDPCKPTIDKLAADLLRVRRLASEIEKLPIRDGGMIEQRGQALLAPTTGNDRFVKHEARAPLESHGILPPLMKRVDEDSPYNISSTHDMYVGQAQLRAAHEAVALRQAAEAGAVTTSHIDDDVHGNAVGTHIVTCSGSQLIIAWCNLALPFQQVLRDMRAPHPSLHALHSLRSLTVLRVGVGDHIFMPPRAPHIVLTIEDKEHLAYHQY